jgi:hypothetical protein
MIKSREEGTVAVISLMMLTGLAFMLGLQGPGYVLAGLTLIYNAYNENRTGS